MSAADVLELVAASVAGAEVLWPAESAADVSEDEVSDELDFTSDTAEDSDEAVIVAWYPAGNCTYGGVTASFHTKVMPRSGCCHSFAVWYREQVSGWPSEPNVGMSRMELFQTSLEDNGTPWASTGKGTVAAEDDEAADACDQNTMLRGIAAIAAATLLESGVGGIRQAGFGCRPARRRTASEH
jgi:hypothetical protein